MLQQRVDQHGQQRAVWHHPHQVRGHRGARICQVTNIFNILLQVTAAATLSVSPRHASLFQNVPGDRADRRGARPHPAARGALLLRPQGQRGQADELPAEPELAAASLSPAGLHTQFSVFKVEFLTKSSRETNCESNGRQKPNRYIHNVSF